MARPPVRAAGYTLPEALTHGILDLANVQRTYLIDALQLANPTADMLADTDAVFRLRGTTQRYVSSGMGLVPINNGIVAGPTSFDSIIGEPTENDNLKTYLDERFSGYLPNGAVGTAVPSMLQFTEALANAGGGIEEIIERPNLASFPVIGMSGRIYVALDTNFIYRWSGSIYIRIPNSPGTTNDITEGSNNLYFTTARVQNTQVSSTALAAAPAAPVVNTDTMRTAMQKVNAYFAALAPRNNPTFTGVVTVPTVSDADDVSTKAVNTAFLANWAAAYEQGLAEKYGLVAGGGSPPPAGNEPLTEAIAMIDLLNAAGQSASVYQFPSDGTSNIVSDFMGSNPLVLRGADTLNTATTLVSGERRFVTVAGTQRAAVLPRNDTSLDFGDENFFCLLYVNMSALPAAPGSRTFAGRCADIDFATLGCWFIGWSGDNQMFEAEIDSNTGVSHNVQLDTLTVNPNTDYCVAISYDAAADTMYIRAMPVGGIFAAGTHKKSVGHVGGTRNNSNENFAIGHMYRGDTTPDSVLAGVASATYDNVYVGKGLLTDAIFAYMGSKIVNLATLQADAAKSVVPPAQTPPPPPPPPPPSSVSWIKPFPLDTWWRTAINQGTATYANPATDKRTQVVRALPNKVRMNKTNFVNRVYEALAGHTDIVWQVSAQWIGDSPANYRAKQVTTKFVPGMHPDPGYLGGSTIAQPWLLQGTNGTTTTVQQDKHLIIVSPDKTYVDEFWYAHNTNPSNPLAGTFRAAAWCRIYFAGGGGQPNTAGVNLQGNYSILLGKGWNNVDWEPWTAGWGPSRAYGGCQLSGLIRAGELTGTEGVNEIDHVICAAAPNSIIQYDSGNNANGVNYMFQPASRADTAGGLGADQVCPLGMRFALPPSFNVNQLSTVAGRKFARGCINYGITLIDAADAGGLTITVDQVGAAADQDAFIAAAADRTIIGNNLVWVRMPGDVYTDV